MKKLIRKVHLYIGLATGLIVFIVAITGCCWVFQKEITAIIEDPIIVENPSGSFISPDSAKAIAQEVFPDKSIHGTAFHRVNEPIEVIFYEPEPAFYQSVFLHPSNGKVIKIKNHFEGFFWFILRGHLYLWLPKKIGSQIMGYGTLLFVLMLLTGIYLWWPKNKKGRKQRLIFDWKPKTNWKRKNFDLHTVVGFYVSLFALIIAFSGLVMAFNWVYFVTYKTWGGEKSPQFIIPPNETTEKTQPASLEVLLQSLREEYPNHYAFEFHYPKTDSSSIYVEISTKEGTYYRADYRFFDQFTLNELDAGSIYGKYNEASLADKVIRMNYDIHVGAIGGLAGKIIAFLASLAVASLPVTGILLWLGRRNKSRKPKQKLAHA